jgi:sulfonate dioxygenase
MAPVATHEASPAEKLAQQKVFNPFYSPDIADNGDTDYKYAKYKVR